MGRTLFLYIFKDLVRYFILAAIALAAIMSFGGLLKPLTKQGLDVAQVGWMITFLMPAMATYSLPIAALFACTMVYGRLSADNEMNACRASGISYLVMVTPAILLGMAVAFLSLLFLSFIVPFFSLQVERVLYSNIAQLVASRIDRNHEITFNNVTIYADDAQIVPSPGDDPNLQIVNLTGPTIVTLERAAGDQKLRTPKDFLTARQATAYIRERGDEPATLEVRLVGGRSFPRELAGGTQVGIGVTSFGPVPIPSAMREGTKFMTIGQLKEVLANPLNSREIAAIRDKGLNQAKVAAFATLILGRLNGPAKSYTFESADERTTLRSGDAPAQVRGDRVVIPFEDDPANRPISFIEVGRTLSATGNERIVQGSAREIRIGIRPSTEKDFFDITLDLHDATLTSEAGAIDRSILTRVFRVPMPPAVAAINQPILGGELGEQLRRQLAQLSNDVTGEIHSRLSFAASCVILVLVGTGLGVLFRSGDFLSAFAVSVIPAVLCVALIVTGQHMAENIPKDISQAPSVLRMGLIFIYSGNVVVLALALLLSFRLQRQ